MKDIQITARYTQSNRRCLMPKRSFGSLGDIGGGGSVAITFGVLAPPRWL